MLISSCNLVHKKRIFDGLESDFIHFVYRLPCPSAHGEIAIRCAEAAPFAQLDLPMQERLAAMINSIEKRLVSERCFYRIDGLPAQQTAVLCDKGAHQFLAVMGCGESQPGRYVVVLAGLFEVE